MRVRVPHGAPGVLMGRLASAPAQEQEVTLDTVSSPPVVAVTIPAVLRTRTGNRAVVRVAGRDVREVIEALDRDYPGLRFNLCYETGELREYVNIFVGGENVRYLNDLETPVTSGTTIHILQSVAGG